MAQQQQPEVLAEMRAWVRGGAKDLQDVVLKAFPDSMNLHSEPGSPMNPTPQMVTQELGALEGYYPHLDASADKQAHLEPYLQRAQSQNQEKDQSKEMER